MKHIRLNMRKTVILLVFYTIAGLLFSQTAMQLLTTIESPFATDTFNWGGTIKGGGDINGDGYNDIVLAGTPLGSKEGLREIYIYLGGSTLNTEPDYIITNPSDPVAAGSTTSFGWAIAYNGDLNGDGYCDLVISDGSYGLFEWGRVYVYFGGPDFSTTPDLILDGLDYNAGLEPMGLYFGCNIDISGDFNGDGFNDLVVSSMHYNLNHYGHVDIFYGGPDFDTVSDWSYYGELEEEFAYSFAVGDINGDGFSDLATMANLSDDGEFCNPVVKLFLGGYDFNNQVDAIYEFDQYYPFATLLMDGDINHDGFNDLVIKNSASKILYGGSEFPDELEDLNLPDPESHPVAYVVSNGTTYLWTVRDNWIEGFVDHQFVSLNSEGEYVTDYQLLYYPEHMRGCAFGYLLGDVNNDGNPDFMVTNKVNDSVVFNIMTTHYNPNSIDDAVNQPVINLSASPNPFKSSAMLSYEIKEPDQVSLSVYNIKGQLLADLDAGYKGSGQHSVLWDGKDHAGRKLASGVYLLRLKIGEKFIRTKKVTLCY